MSGQLCHIWMSPEQVAPRCLILPPQPGVIEATPRPERAEIKQKGGFFLFFGGGFCLFGAPAAPGWAFSESSCPQRRNETNKCVGMGRDSAAASRACPCPCPCPLRYQHPADEGGKSSLHFQGQQSHKTTFGMGIPRFSSALPQEIHPASVSVWERLDRTSNVEICTFFFFSAQLHARAAPGLLGSDAKGWNCFRDWDLSEGGGHIQKRALGGPA